MGDRKVETTGRLAQWKIENFGLVSLSIRSDPFKIGIWNWSLLVEKSWSTCIRLSLENSRVSEEQPPVARFILLVTTPGSNGRTYTSPIYERLVKTSDGFPCPVDACCKGRLVIEVEFLDLKISPVKGGELSYIWPSVQNLATQHTLKCLSHILNESIHSDVTIITAGGSLQAHRAILSTTSPVFHSMFQHNLREKESSTIEIEDMTYESCKTLLNYLYGTINEEDFCKHRLSLLGAAHKYNIVDLKDACEGSLVEDINLENVLERLQEACLYQLDRLKKGCLMYLLDFRKIYDLREEMNDFFRKADGELVVEMFQHLLAVWKPT